MAQTHTLRIIGGTYKGKKLNILDVEGLRPTPDRLREDIFNLLGPLTEGARVLDLFAGSGVLGLECISRNAAALTLVEKDRDNYLNLLNEVRTFKEAAKIKVVQADALIYLKGLSETFDLIFLDPPYQSNLLKESLTLITEQNLLSPEGRIYAEMPHGVSLVTPGLEAVVKRSAGQVSYVILKKSSFLF